MTTAFHPSTSVHTTLKALHNTLTDSDLQKMLHLQLLHTILDTHFERQNDLPEPSQSPYFFNSKSASLKHASLILRTIKNRRLPRIRLHPKNPDEIYHLLQTLWYAANDTAKKNLSSDENTLGTYAARFIESVLKAETSDTSSMAVKDETILTHLFEAAWQFGIEYYTFCLERIYAQAYNLPCLSPMMETDKT